MDTLSSIMAAIVAGATANAQDIASDLIKSAYHSLKSLVITKLGKAGAVQSVEDTPSSEAAQTNLAQTLSDANLHLDEEVKRESEQLLKLITEEQESGGPGLGDVNIALVRGRVNALVEDLRAQGNVRVGPVIGETGDATVRRIGAGAASNNEELAPKN